MTGIEAEDLRRAIAAEEFRVVYQPEVNLRTGHVMGVEALIRWQHPLRGLVPPAEFIPMAERSGLVSGIGTWMLGTAIDQAAHWSHSRFDGAGVPIWVNISASRFGEDGLVDLVESLLHAHEVDPHLIGIEITETVLLEDTREVSAVLAELHSLGVQLAIDDFGTGYSSLAYLKRLPLDAIKIDRSFVSGISVGSRDALIVSAITDLARALRLLTIAEGVERPSEVRALRELNCDHGQGYVFTSPLPAVCIDALLAADRRGALFRYEDPPPRARRAMGTPLPLPRASPTDVPTAPTVYPG